MKTLITGHRLHKLLSYDIEWIKLALREALDSTFLEYTTYGLSGMASGVDLWFCEALMEQGIHYAACIPFEGQEETMDEESATLRVDLIAAAAEVISVRNSGMVEKANWGLVVWDGNKGGTHNVFQQLVENKKSFVWINPVSQKIIEIEC